MSLATVITPAILDKSLHALAPLFLTTANDDLPAARHAASRLLASYEIETEQELCLVTAFIGFAFGALEALSQSMAPGLTPNVVLRLRGNATAQQRSADRCRRSFESLRRQRRLAHGHPPGTQPDPEAEAAGLAMPETLTLGDYAPPPSHPAPAIILPRQRHLTPQAAKQRGAAQTSQSGSSQSHSLGASSAAQPVKPRYSRARPPSPA